MSDAGAAPQEEQKLEGIYIDGVPYTLDDLTFRELDEATAIVRELADDKLAELDTAHDRHFLPAAIVVIKRRTDPEFTVDQARDMTPTELAPPRPTKPAAKKKAASRKP